MPDATFIKGDTVKPPGDQVNVYGGVPPLITSPMLPLVDVHVVGFVNVKLAVNELACVIATTCV